METLGGRNEIMVIVMELEVAGLPLGQVALDTITQVMTSKFCGVSKVKTGPFTPLISTEFTLHS